MRAAKPHDVPGAFARRTDVPRGSAAAARITERGVGAGVRAGGSARLGPARTAAAGLRGVTDGGAADGASRVAVVVRPKATCRTGPAAQHALMLMLCADVCCPHAGHRLGAADRA